jgi:excinuclease ABC subunit A
MRIDGQVVTTDEEPNLDPKKSHDIEIVVDRMVVRDFEPVKEKLSDGTEVEQVNPNRARLADSVELSLRKGDGMIYVLDADSGEVTKFSDRFVNPDYPEMSIPEIEPRSFSFNSPHGACEHCHGLGSILQIDSNSIVPNPELTVNEGAIHPWATSAGRMSYMLQTLSALAKKHKFSLDVPWNKLTPEAQKIVLYGHPDKVEVDYSSEKFDGRFQTSYKGVIPNLERRHKETDSAYTRQQIEAYMFELPCPDCHGKRLRKEILGVTVGGKNIVDGTALSVTGARKFFQALVPSGHKDKKVDTNLPDVPELSEYEYAIVRKVVSEIVARLSFLENVGLKYLTLDRSAATL